MSPNILQLPPRHPQQIGQPQTTQRDQATQTRSSRSSQDIQIQLNVISNTNVINNTYRVPVDAEVNTEVVREGDNLVNIFTDAILNPAQNELEIDRHVDQYMHLKDKIISAVSFFILIYLFIKEQTRQP